eukprot:NODE_3235_length_1391_cov_49.633281_g2811_i0.p1 GENE.NODE_3235_length_1391_cov_49.633281_g2811_i0~~NODE_3235_length_1391_cov_49.633281_g2811_i0.p1  ORF type:complete len:447 (-),score=52.43 NODE_3235_length_1391_cov_49.633281_g2811_i0:51-1208(-)
MRIEGTLLWSASFFWPKSHPIVLVLDETFNDKQYGKYLEKNYGITVHYEPLLNASIMPQVPNRLMGYIQIFWSIYYADQHCDTDVIAYLDADVGFTTLVTPYILFDDKKRPVIHAQQQRNEDPITKTLLNISPGVYFPFYFPILLFKRHLVSFREHVVKLHKMSFDKFYFEKVFQLSVFKSAWCSECNHVQPLLTYIWTYHRNDYSWHIKDYDGPYNLPYPRAAFHSFKNPINLILPITQSICHTTFHVYPECKIYKGRAFGSIIDRGGTLWGTDKYPVEHTIKRYLDSVRQEPPNYGNISYLFKWLDCWDKMLPYPEFWGLCPRDIKITSNMKCCSSPKADILEKNCKRARSRDKPKGIQLEGEEFSLNKYWKESCKITIPKRK